MLPLYFNSTYETKPSQCCVTQPQTKYFLSHLYFIYDFSKLKYFNLCFWVWRLSFGWFLILKKSQSTLLIIYKNTGLNLSKKFLLCSQGIRSSSYLLVTIFFFILALWGTMFGTDLCLLPWAAFPIWGLSRSSSNLGKISKHTMNVFLNYRNAFFPVSL